MHNSGRFTSDSQTFRSVGPFRHIAESLVLLAIGVVMFRGLALEGFLISTGSMAPTLLGFHHGVVCPECSFEFARGTQVDELADQIETAWVNFDRNSRPEEDARCPNCGFSGIRMNDLPKTEGDQLLVHKHAYDFRNPRRWEVVVFRNPGDSTQAYVKRVVGLPDESIEISQGDIYIDGKLARKPFHVQNAIKIPISEYAAHIPSNDPDSRATWVLLNENSPWNLEADSLTYTAPVEPGVQNISWVGYRHWVRSGGSHVTSVPLEKWPGHLHPLDVASEPLVYRGKQLQTTGTFSDLERRKWISRSDDPQFQQAFQNLWEQSHLAPIVDEYGYNSINLSSQPVDEFFCSMTLSDVRGNGRFEIELSNGVNVFTVIIKKPEQTVELLKNGDPIAVRSTQFSDSLFHAPVKIDFSLIDHQAILAFNNKEVFAPFEFEPAKTVSKMKRPVRFGAAGMSCRVRELCLYRDITYTSPPNHPKPRYQMGQNEYFVLGDNSPVSVDSRVWNDPAVPRSAFIGKPLIVHLPSRSQPMNWQGKSRFLRLPDFSKVRFIH
ncbi:signal peptidase I [Planctomicrobium sp. SH668]|uniref:signal peptidase I n=1 Tax=Planctomicrobium sp. SH668 TaxID=3448126 RepID=UPI003F5C8428